MVVKRGGRPARKPATPARRTATKTAPKPAVKKGPDVTVYADKEPTGYHKAFARWIVREVGYSPSQAESAKDAFLMGVSIATAARPAFQNSDFLAEWRETTGEVKRGPKPKSEVANSPRRGTKSKPVVADDDFDDDDEEFDAADEDDELDDDDFDESDADEDDDDSEDEDDDFDDEEEEPEPPKSTRGRSKAAPAATRGNARTAGTKQAARGRAKAKPVDDDEDLF